RSTPSIRASSSGGLGRATAASRQPSRVSTGGIAMRTATLLSALLGLNLIAGPARARGIFQYEADRATHSGGPGAPGSVQGFLQETVTGSSTSLLASEGGLFSGAFYATRTGSPLNPATITGVSQNPAFVGDLTSAAAPTQARLAEDALFNSSGVT